MQGQLEVLAPGCELLGTCRLRAGRGQSGRWGRRGWEQQGHSKRLYQQHPPCGGSRGGPGHLAAQHMVVSDQAPGPPWSSQHPGRGHQEVTAGYLAQPIVCNRLGTMGTND